MSKAKRFNKSKKTKRRIVYLICLLVLIVLGIAIGVNSKNKNEETQGLLNEVVVDNTQKDKANETERMLQVKALKEQYEGIVGWLEVPGTNINYPVMQGADNEYYVKHNYKQEYDFNGSIFLHKDYDWNIPSSNLLLYGHNNKNDIMFAQLLKYKDESFYKQNPIIKFTTPEEDSEFDIIAVFLSRVYYKSEKNVFRYYDFINIKSEEEYNEYVQNSKESSLYNIDATANYGDKLITLTTCEYSQEDGRFVVVGRKKV